MSQRVQIVVLCEDLQTSVLARCYLLSKGFSEHQIRVVRSPGGQGSAYSFVLSRFPGELAEMRKSPVSRCLLAMIDEDGRSEHSVAGFQAECQKAGVPFCSDDEPVAILIPKRNIETWIKFLSGEEVSEAKDYKAGIHRRQRLISGKLPIRSLNELCSHNQRQNWPSSLANACREIRKILR